jgi:hypothetical protein
MPLISQKVHVTYKGVKAEGTMGQQAVGERQCHEASES